MAEAASVEREADFEGLGVTVIQFKGQRVFAASQVATAAGYGETKNLTRLFERNPDDFEVGRTHVVVDGAELVALKSMAAQMAVSEQGVNLTPCPVVLANARRATLLTERGLMRVLMLARTPQGVRFRDWVEDLLDELHQNGSVSIGSNPEPAGSSARSGSHDLTVALAREQRLLEQHLLRKRKHEMKLVERATNLLRTMGHGEHAQAVELRHTGEMIGEDFRQFLPREEGTEYVSASDLAKELAVSNSTIGRFAVGFELQTQASIHAGRVLKRSTHVPERPNKQVTLWLYREPDVADLVRRGVSYWKDVNAGLRKSQQITIATACEAVLAQDTPGSHA